MAVMLYTWGLATHLTDEEVRSQPNKPHRNFTEDCDCDRDCDCDCDCDCNCDCDCDCDCD
eukprot:387241-Pyramimonas_sp.AAC.2